MCNIAVAPLVGAWIEINLLTCYKYIIWSLLSWERGLKLSLFFMHFLTASSLLSWERGLKYSTNEYTDLAEVAPLVGAWIEII